MCILTCLLLLFHFGPRPRGKKAWRLPARVAMSSKPTKAETSTRRSRNWGPWKNVGSMKLGIVTWTCKLWFCLPSFFLVQLGLCQKQKKIKCEWFGGWWRKNWVSESDLPTENPQKVDPVGWFSPFFTRFFSRAWCGFIGFLSINHYCRKSTGNKKA